MIYWLDENGFPNFPSTQTLPPITTEPLALGGRVSPLWLDQAYRRGIFPWHDPIQTRMWWSLSPRAVITPASFRLPRTVRKLLNKPQLVTCNLAFSQVMRACAQPSDRRPETWISEEMIESYSRLHQAGRALSVELWQDNQLAGGLYGLLIGRAFFGESMFSHTSNASKIAFATVVPHLWQQGIELIDCQMHTDHLAQFGLLELTRTDFEHLLNKAVNQPSIPPLPTWL